MSRFTLTDTVAEVVDAVNASDTEKAFNFAHLVLWRVEHHGSWLTDREEHLVANVINDPPKARRRRRK